MQNVKATLPSRRAYFSPLTVKVIAKLAVVSVRDSTFAVTTGSMICFSIVLRRKGRLRPSVNDNLREMMQYLPLVYCVAR